NSIESFYERGTKMNDLNQEMANLELDCGSFVNLSHEALSHQDSVQSMSSQDDDVIIDASKMVECEQNDSEYLLKENLVTVLKTYKAMLEHLKSKKHQSAPYQDQNLTDLESFIFQSNRQEQIIKQDHQIDIQIDQINSELKEIIFTNLRISESIEEHELPRNIIVAQLPKELFANLDIKSKFERLFIDLEPECKFFYFRIFKRCLIQFEDPLNAILARFELDDFIFLSDRLRIFLTKPIRLKNSRPFLEPPKNDKTFLISPPSSPPIGWEQTHEDPPVVNYDLLAALSKLNPDEPCELIKSSESFPGIVVHPCGDMDDPTSNIGYGSKKFIPTKRPAYDF
ncbi:calcipressin-1 isoform X1, partial [Brachionus plicatilis]